MRSLVAKGGVVCGAALALLVVAEREARACGGCFTPPPVMMSESVITDEKMVLSVSMSQTTLYDQINYSGSPSSFAWVLPIKGTVTVGLSADIMFQTIDSFTTTTVQQPPNPCPPPPYCYYGGGTSGTEGSSATESSSGSVVVTGNQQVGPYEAVQLHSNDGSALNAWLTQHGYQIPASTRPIIAAYVAQHFDFLALKLVPGQGVQSMQPVRVTSQGAAPSLPLHMVAVGTGPTTGITIWVVAEGRWAPSNFPTFTITDADLVWDWSTDSSNYETVRLAKEASFHGAGWQIESSLELAQYSIQSSLLNSVQYYGYGSGAGGYTSLPTTPVTDGGAPVDASTGDAGVDQVAAATADLAVLFNGISGPNVRVTRMRSDVAKSALSVDMALEASTDQSELSNVYIPSQQINIPVCTVYPSCGGTVTPGSTGPTTPGSTGPTTTPGSTGPTTTPGSTGPTTTPGSTTSGVPPFTSSGEPVTSTGGPIAQSSSGAPASSTAAGSVTATTTGAPPATGSAGATSSTSTAALFRPGVNGVGGCSTSSPDDRDSSLFGGLLALGGIGTMRARRRRRDAR